ncbi:MAG: V-type ATPase subunit [Candidatus Hermodarchaeota archaeon]
MNYTSVIVPSYAFTLIKIGFLKQLIMDDMTLQKLEDISEIKQFIEFIGVFYPGLAPSSYKTEDIERALFHTYVQLIGKILNVSPNAMRIFLKNYLLKYEIMNIKNVILGTILGIKVDEKVSMVNMLVEKYLNNEKFIKDLIEITSLEEIQLYMRSTIYNKVIREGILYFKNTNEIFVLEAFLDRLYYENLQNEVKNLTQKERAMISLYVSYVSEIYNLNIIYRGIKNQIDKNLLLQFLVNSYLFMNEKELEDLVDLKTINEFITVLTQLLSEKKELKSSLNKIPLDYEHFIWSVEKIYLEFYFKKIESKKVDIDYQAILKILELLIKKDKEIRLFILPKVVRILHDKYKLLK